MAAPGTERQGQLNSPAAASPPKHSPPAPVSYAQAAKGRSQSVPSTTESSKTTSGSITPAKEFSLTPATTSGVPSTKSWPDETTDVEDSTNMVASPKILDVRRVSVDATTSKAQTEQEVQRRGSITTSSEVGNSTTTHVKGDDDGSLRNSSADASWDSKTLVSIPQEKRDTSVERRDSRNEKRKGRNKGKEKEADAELQEEDKPASMPLKEAPIPAVNFWQQRAQEAKEKAAARPGMHKVAGLASGPTSPLNLAKPEGGKVAGSRSRSNERKKQDSSTREARQPDSIPLAPENDKRRLGMDSRGSQDDQNTPRQRSRPAQTTNDQSSTVGGKGTPKSKGLEMTERSKPPPAPPSVKDQISWPTPDSAQEEERKKALGRGEKMDKDRSTVPVSKPHGKNEWVQLPYTPSVVFDTPLPDINPRRGGRGGRSGVRGAREGGRGAAHASIGRAAGPSTEEESVPSRRGRLEGDDAVSRQLLTWKGNQVQTTAEAERARTGAGEQPAEDVDVSNLGKPTQPATVPEGKSSAVAYEGAPDQERPQHHTDLQRGAGGSREGNSTAPERRRGSESFSKESDGASKLQTASRRTSLAIRVNGTVDSGGPSARERTSRNTAGNAALFREQEHGEKRQQSHEVHTRSRNSGTKITSHMHPFEASTHLSFRNERDRRHERGRGGSRGGRSHGYTNGHPSASFARSPSYPSYSSQNSQFGGSAHQARSWRQSNRSQSIPTDDGLSRHTSRFSVPSMTPLQAYMNQYYYETGMYPLSPTPFTPTLEQHSVIGLIATQLDYYFSMDNLVKDVYLRRHMDSQGFVFLDVVHGFNRLKGLTTDPELLKFACLQSHNVELRVGQDGKYRIRKRDGWEQWVLEMSERDPSAQNEGPATIETPPTPYPHGFNLTSFRDSLLSPGSPQDGFGATSADMLNPIANGYLTGPSFHMVSNGIHQAQGRLSAVVADFEPGNQAVPPAYRKTSPDRGAEEDSFPDEAIDSLFVVRRHEISPQQAAFHSLTSRSFSNGSIDKRTLTAEGPKTDEQQSQTEANGAPDLAQQPELQRQMSHDIDMSCPPDAHRQEARLSYASGSPERMQSYNSMRLFWVKDKETPVEYLPPDSTHELYVDLRDNALSQRGHATEGTCPHEMDVLYQFWSHFLIRNFNARMYDEFRRLALEDVSQKQTRNGIENLSKFYAESLASKNLIRDRIVEDYAELVKSEDQAQGRPAFKQLRAAWRNGAMNLKNRKKLGDLIDAELKGELDR